MPGHWLEIGEHGDISYRSVGGLVTATSYYHNTQGQRRCIPATESFAAVRAADPSGQVILRGTGSAVGAWIVTQGCRRGSAVRG